MHIIKEVLAAKVWDCSNQMRGSIDANDYKDFLFGLIFYKYLSERQEERLRKEFWEEKHLKALTADNTEELDKVRGMLHYAIPYENLFSQWIAKGKNFTIKDVLDSIEIFDRNIDPKHRDVYKGVFSTFSGMFTKLGLSPLEQTKLVKKMIEVVATIPAVMEDGGDALGYIYEYLMARFASGAGKKAGEFYTPAPVSKLMSQIIVHHLRERDGISVYDPTSGSGSLLLHIGREFEKAEKGTGRVQYYAQEKMKSTYNLGRMNLIMRGVEPEKINARNADTLENDWICEDHEPLKVDAVAANPPYGIEWDIKDKELDPRFVYGVAPKSAADYAFLEHGLYHLNEDGIMAYVFPQGVLFRGGCEEAIRKNLVENNLIDTIILLPSDMFYGTAMSVIIMVLKRNKEDDNILFIDASSEFEKQKKNVLTEAHAKKIFETYRDRKGVKGFAELVTKEEVIKNGYNLNIPRYIRPEKEPTAQLEGLMTGKWTEEERNRFKEYWDVFPTLKDQVYAGYALNEKELDQIILENKDVLEYKESTRRLLTEARDDLWDLLLHGYADSHVDGLIDELGARIYAEFENVPLIDKYKAYDGIYKTTKRIKTDIEFIKSNTKEAEKAGISDIAYSSHILHKPDDKEKKKKYLNHEVMTGEIIPIEAVWEMFFKEEKVKVEEQYTANEEIKAQKKELMARLTEAEMETLEKYSIISDKKDKIRATYFNKAKKSGEDVQSIEWVVEEWQSLSKKEIKNAGKDIEELIQAGVDKIQHLTKEECEALLEDKWVCTLTRELERIADIPVNNLKKGLREANKGYVTGGLDINRKIKEAHEELIDAIGRMDYDAAILNLFIDFLAV